MLLPFAGSGGKLDVVFRGKRMNMAAFSLKSLICVCGLLGLLAPAAAAADDVWAKYASENFVIYTASSQGKAENVLQHLERVRRAYAHMLDVELGGEQPVNVLLFKNQKEYFEYAPTKTSFGYYTQALGRDFIVIADFNESIELVLNHEYFHLYARSRGFNWPTWANEGFADYFSTLKLAEKTLDVGYPIENHMLYLRNTGRKLNAESLFAMGSQERHEAGKREVSDLYAMSWTLVHFIMSDSELSARRDQMVAALQQHDDSAVAFKQVYGWDLKKVDEQLGAYVKRSTMQYTRMDVERGQLTFDAPVASAELKAWEAPLLLADVMTNVRKYDEAEKEYVRLAAIYPDAPDIDDSRAQLLMRKGERESATPFLRAAVAKGSTNPYTYKFLAFNECPGSPTPECLELTGKAVALSPDDKQLKFFRIGLLNQADQFYQALVLANKVGKVTSEEAPMFFYQAAYASYRLGKIDDAKKAIAMGLQHATEAPDRMRLEQLSAAIDRPQMTMVAVPRPVTDGGPPVLRRPDPTTEDETQTQTPEEFQADEGRRNDALRSRASAPPVESVAQRLVNSLIAEGATLATAQLKNMDCSTIPPALTVQTELGTMKILIDSPSLVSIIRDGRIADDYQFTCGTQSGETIRVGYAASAEGAPGVFLRLLQFGEI